MPHSIDQILPSLQSLGLWSYWIIGIAALLEGYFITGVFTPGTLVVDAGGILVQRGMLDFYDLVWFVAIGSAVGGELGYWTGRLLRRGLKTRWQLEKFANFQRAVRLFQRHGGMALVFGRFLGPISGLVPLAAAMSGMERRRFTLWNALSGIPYAFAHVALGYFLGDLITNLGPMTTRIVLFAAGAFFGIALLWYLVLRIVRMLPFVLAILKFILAAALESPELRAWVGRHPRLAGAIARRFDRSGFSGLTATLLGLTLLYILTVWVGSALNFLMAEPIVQVDTRLASLIHALWNPALLRFFAHVTALGDWKIVAILFAAVTAALWLRRQGALALGVVVAMAGDLISVAALKAAFDRPRPDLAYFAETSGSFPSGHAAIAVAFYAMVCYVAWRQRLLRPVSAALLAVTVAFLIGLSRLYLIEHYLSDILNGYFVGAAWLVIGISVAEWRAETHPPEPERAPRAPQVVIALMLGVAMAGASWFDLTYDKARGIAPRDTAAQIVTDIPALFSSGRAALATEAITGSALEPINMVIVAKDIATFNAAMADAGWIRANAPGPASLARAAWAAATNQEDLTAPVTPYFWEGQPNDHGFQKPTPDRTVRKRHHARFWDTRFKTPDGAQIFVGSASYDDGLTLGVLHHIAPNIDTERDQLAADLQAAGAVTQTELLQLSTPHQGQDVAGDPWYTDGKAVIVHLN